MWLQLPYTPELWPQHLAFPHLLGRKDLSSTSRQLWQKYTVYSLWSQKLSYYMLGICEGLWSKENDYNLLQIYKCLVHDWRWGDPFSRHSLVYLFLIKYFSETVHKKEVETHFGVYFWFVWAVHTTVFPKEVSSKHYFSNHPCRHFESSYPLNLHKVSPGLISCDLWINSQSRTWMQLVDELNKNWKVEHHRWS